MSFNLNTSPFGEGRSSEARAFATRATDNLLPWIKEHYQIYTLKTKNEKSCLNIFKSNNFLGSIIFVNLFIGKLIA